MKDRAVHLRRNLLLFTACTMVGMVAAAGTARAQTTTTTTDTYKLQKIKVEAKKLLLREKDIPAAVSHITETQIEAENPVMGSIQTVLKQTPSVNAYNQGPGQSAPTLEVRGVRNSELSETLDGIPITDLLDGSGNYLSNNVGSPISLSQISGVTVLPGVAPPDQQGFGTIGGTIAYTSKEATDERYGELEGGYGSFNTSHFGFNLSTGKMWDSDDAPRALLMFDQSETNGYVSNTPAHYHDMLFNINKPYDDGLSNIGLTVIYNQGNGLIQSQPSPLPYVQQKYTYNFPISDGYYEQGGQFLTTILKDHTFINSHLIFDGSLYYIHSESQTQTYTNPQTLIANQENIDPYLPQIQNPWTFFNAMGPTAAADLGSPFYSPGYFTYDPLQFAPPGADPTNPNGQAYIYGETSEETFGHSNEIGITPKFTIFAGEHNTFTVGALLSKESSGGSQYIYGSPNMPTIDGYNSIAFGGGAQRTIFMGYAQDKIDILNNKLHLLLGVRATGAYSSNVDFLTSGIYFPQKLQNYSRSGDPYVGISYDLPAHFTAYGSFGKAEVFAPVSDYSEGLSGTTTAPGSETVHLYEAGIRYDTPKLYANVDYYYQKVNDAFGFFDDFLTDEQIFGNPGSEQFRGVEMDAQYQATPELQLFANGSYNQAQYLATYSAFDTVQEDQFGVANKDTPFSNVPDWISNFGFEEDHGPFTARFTGQYTGREYKTTDILSPNPILNGATITDVNDLNPANVVFNLLLTYKVPVHYHGLKELTFSLNGQNIFDEHYYEYTYSQYLPVGGCYGCGPSVKEALIGPPTSVTFDVSAKF
jgi:iron complex outermembrane receptor protein